jgi:hypothetical protein
MRPEDFRRLALALPGAIEASHMRHPDFRVGKRVFATLGYPSDEWGMVKLSPDQQALVVTTQPDVFTPVKGAWGAHGATNVKLCSAHEESVTNVLRLAWQAVSETSKPAPTHRKNSSAPKKASRRPRTRKTSKSAKTKREKASDSRRHPMSLVGSSASISQRVIHFRSTPNNGRGKERWDRSVRADRVEKVCSCDAEISVIQSVQLGRTEDHDGTSASRTGCVVL